MIHYVNNLNPFAAPNHCECVAPRERNNRDDDDPRLVSPVSGWGRFICHMAIASFVAPWLCGVGLCVAWSFHSDEPPFGIIVWAPIFAAFLAFFVQPIMLPVGVVTFGICQWIARAKPLPHIVWGVGTSVIGATIGLFIFDRGMPDALTTYGFLCGAPVGLMLRWIWTPSRKATLDYAPYDLRRTLQREADEARRFLHAIEIRDDG